jgi:NAD(P)-dependent dehydrogenase (short-subunit alcohol dehydrogenase family)
VARAVKELGGIDGLVNNAGVYPRSPFLELSEAEWDHILDVNLKGSCLCARAAAQAMIAGGRRGSVINLSSSSVRGQPRGVHYTASKGGIITMTRTMALELAPHGIRVNAIAPGTPTMGTPDFSTSTRTRPPWTSFMIWPSCVRASRAGMVLVFTGVALRLIRSDWR